LQNLIANELRVIYDACVHAHALEEALIPEDECLHSYDSDEEFVCEEEECIDSVMRSRSALEGTLFGEYSHDSCDMLSVPTQEVCDMSLEEQISGRIRDEHLASPKSYIEFHGAKHTEDLIQGEELLDRLQCNGMEIKAELVCPLNQTKQTVKLENSPNGHQSLKQLQQAVGSPLNACRAMSPRRPNWEDHKFAAIGATRGLHSTVKMPVPKPPSTLRMQRSAETALFVQAAKIAGELDAGQLLHTSARRPPSCPPQSPSTTFARPERGRPQRPMSARYSA
jgi:hypothetical protein